MSGFDDNEGFLIQPLNGLGENDGKPMVEEASNVHLLPAVDAEVRVDDGKCCKVTAYSLVSASVNLKNTAKKRRQDTRNTHFQYFVIFC